MKKLQTASLFFWIAITIIPIVGVIVGLVDADSYKESQLFWQKKILVFGALAPLAFIALQILQVVLTPISHYSVSVLGGFLFGPFWGTIFNWIGRVIGHLLAFYLTHFFGRKLIQRFVSSKTIAKYDSFIADKSLILFIVYALPLFPDDEISYLVGLSKIKPRKFLPVVIFGQLVGSLALAYVGSGIDGKDWFFWLLISLAIAGFIWLWFLTKKKSPRNPLLLALVSLCLKQLKSGNLTL